MKRQFKGNCETGQLTEKGYQQAKVVGELFRNAYIPELISRRPADNEVCFLLTKAILHSNYLFTGGV
jgi:hypothetical protein